MHEVRMILFFRNFKFPNNKIKKLFSNIYKLFRILLFLEIIKN